MTSPAVKIGDYILALVDRPHSAGSVPAGSYGRITNISGSAVHYIVLGATREWYANLDSEQIKVLNIDHLTKLQRIIHGLEES